MRKCIACLCLILLTLGVGACANQPADAPEALQQAEQGQVIGTVNGEDIYRYEYDYYLNTYFNEYFNNYYDSLKMYQGVDMLVEESSLDLLSNLEDFAWQSVVQGALIRQMAADYGLALEPAYYAQLLLPAFTLSLDTNRLYLELFPLIQEEAQAAKVVTEEEARAVYDSDPAAWDCRRAAHIIITADQMKEEALTEGNELNDAQATEAAKVRAEEIIAQLNAGGDFAALAAEYSGDSSAQTGGEMNLYFNAAGTGISEVTSFDPIFSAGTFALAEIGDYSDTPVESSFGFHIIKLSDKKEGFGAVREYVINSLQVVDTTAASAYFQQKLADKQAEAEIVCNVEFKYFVDESAAEEEEPATP